MGIRIWLDDKRSPPDGHVSCRWPEEVIALLKKGDVDSISLDHDLGEDSGYENPTIINPLFCFGYRGGRLA